MPLDPSAAELLKQMASAGMPALDTLSPQAARAQMTAMQKARGGAVEPVHKVDNRTIPGPAGPIAVRVYTPAGAGPFPLLVYYHGGGWVIGDLESHDNVCRSLTNQAQCVTVSVDYRLAPEHKFPAAVDDAYAAALWVAEHARELNGDSAQLAVGGDSAGASLSAVLAHLARDRGKPGICFQLLIYPATDPLLDTESRRVNTEYLLTPGMIRYFYSHYIRTDADLKDPLLSPAHASNFRGLPPALIITAEYDPLRDEAEVYGETLRKAGVPVEMTRYNGMFHGFFGMGEFLEKGKQAVAQAAQALRRAFGK